MTERLTIDRFEELADAYGGVVARWPVHHRAAAYRLATHPEAAAILARALAFDAMLDAWQAPVPTAALIGRVTAAGPAAAAITLGAQMRLWWSGVGIAAALAGAAAGMAAVAMVGPADTPSGGSTSFGDVAGRDS